MMLWMMYRLNIFTEINSLPKKNTSHISCLHSSRFRDNDLYFLALEKLFAQKSFL